MDKNLLYINVAKVLGLTCLKYHDLVHWSKQNVSAVYSRDILYLVKTQ